ncbi:hypothetical protein PC123_g17894 [Phytophthora cactorum]|nr:hypothetical protein PC123_g17894 [Phytophthora cactorum]
MTAVHTRRDIAADALAGQSSASHENIVAPTQLTEPFAGLAVRQTPCNLPSEILFLKETFLREHKSEKSETPTKITAAHVDIPTHAEAFPRNGYRSWDQVVTAAETYVGSHGFRFRIRSSQLVSTCKRSDAAEIPQDVKYWLKRYRCIHGVIQPSRGGGVRDAYVNFTDCKARFDVAVTKVKIEDDSAVWCIIAKNEWRTHNHHMDAVPRVRWANNLSKKGAVMDSIAIIADAGAAPRQIAGSEICFLLSNVLLCQFHALVYWKKILGTTFGLTPADRDIAQQCFANMIPTEKSYLHWLKELQVFAKSGNRSVLTYFNKNWKGCRNGYFLERGDLIDVREDLGEALSTTDSTQIPRVPLASQPKLIQQTDGFAAGKEVLVQDTHFVCIIDASKA